MLASVLQAARRAGALEAYSTLDTFPNPLQHVNTVTMSELIITSSAYNINGDSPTSMTSVANHMIPLP